MFHLPGGEPVMSGEGHSGWLAAVAFHPQATVLASGAGDAAVKLWSFRRRRCVATLQGGQIAAVLLGSLRPIEQCCRAHFLCYTLSQSVLISGCRGGALCVAPVHMLYCLASKQSAAAAWGTHRLSPTGSITGALSKPRYTGRGCLA